ncbi:MAG: DUF2270 domain-containing protein [Anaerolineae bacterium]
MSEGTGSQHQPEQRESEWTFRGYHLDASDFSTAMAHLYRGEVSRANTWRTRLDTTTNWAVITVAAALTFTFGEPQNPHFVLLVVFLLMLTFLGIEARRYRYYALWSYRARLMETDFFAAMLAPPFRPSSDWASVLSEALLHPNFPIAQWEAIARRFRSNYLWLVSLLLVSWGVKLALHPVPAADWTAVVDRAGIGLLPGSLVVSAVALIYGILMTLAAALFIPRRLREAFPGIVRRVGGPLVPEPAARERLATIITSFGGQVARRLLEELGRGVTGIRATGMYTSEPRDVLLCAVTDVQVSHLEEIVGQVDPEAFVVVSPAEEVRGTGFRPFEPPS